MGLAGDQLPPQRGEVSVYLEVSPRRTHLYGCVRR